MNNHTLMAIIANATELQEYADNGGNKQYAFDLCVNTSELDMASDILSKLLDNIIAEIYTDNRSQ